MCGIGLVLTSQDFAYRYANPLSYANLVYIVCVLFPIVSFFLYPVVCKHRSLHLSCSLLFAIVSADIGGHSGGL